MGLNLQLHYSTVDSSLHNSTRLKMVDINIGLDEIKTKGLWRAVIAEVLGTALFLLGTTVVCLASGTSGAATNIAIGIGIGLSITNSIIMVGHVSGGHLNPAVSFAMTVAGKVSILRGLLYIIAQLVGGIVGSAFTYGLLSPAVGTLGATVPSVKEAQGFGLELLFTLILVLFVFSITDGAKSIDGGVTALAVGVCILVAHVCLIPFTGCGINPARSFGPAVVANVWTSHWIYWIGPLAGALVGAILYTFVLGHCDSAAAEEPA